MTVSTEIRLRLQLLAWSAVTIALGLGAGISLGQSETNFIQLKDGIIVYPGEATQVYPLEAEQPIYSVSGKAYFQVDHSQDTLSLRLSDITIKAQKASFLISTRHDQVKVTVESGLVSIEKTDASALSISLSAEEVALMQAGNKGFFKHPNNNPNYLAWITKELRFTDTPLSEVARILQEVYCTPVSLSHQDLAQCLLTAQFKKKSLKEVLKHISKALNVSYELTEQQATISGKGCLIKESI